MNPKKLQEHLRKMALKKTRSRSTTAPEVITTPIPSAINEFYLALNEAQEISRSMVFEDSARPMDKQTVDFAVQSLLPIIEQYKLPPPLILPLQNAGVDVEWHMAGMNIELRFRSPYHVYAVLEDVQSAIQEYHGRDPNLLQAIPALACLSSRMKGVPLP